MSTVAVPRITPGLTLAVEPRDDHYGAEMALLIVKSISVDQETLSSLEWVLIQCTRLRHDGAVLEPEFSPLIEIGEDGVLYMSVGIAEGEKEDDEGMVDYPVFFCPFCGTQLQEQDEEKSA